MGTSLCGHLSYFPCKVRRRQWKLFQEGMMNLRWAVLKAKERCEFFFWYVVWQHGIVRPIFWVFSEQDMLYQDFGVLTTSQTENRDAKCRSDRNETDKQDIGTQTNVFMVIVSVFFPFRIHYNWKQWRVKYLFSYRLKLIIKGSQG